ncbi:3-oxoacyl-[acyl-carrier-protein] reductase FabG-like isoform X2 [Sitodiplosis mosellana]|uniref:3-oxoacyl-[acyl-carrier-protein] reductase FabG-like isoform X2 n=1 Tax=Sitodiplosis mosellana TaxID=263140 RepID=UPI002443ABDB|nr:3-oxoacyl-[acyl-carrier-protein] reductase FabG-like isoform X2 [Sitodiplosis mosellana]
MELASKGVRVNSCNPGFVDTDFYTIARGIGTDTEEYNEIVEQNKRKHPLQRIGYPDDCAKFITGVLLRVDGGISTKGAF